jgi:hypothetical protein
MGVVATFIKDREKYQGCQAEAIINLQCDD